ncbi:MAG: alpha/beta hydrolase [Solirubrobacteraceae bacterium]|nr:alpha/beta hydrolase [Solirubrobacteraceae bacterium]
MSATTSTTAAFPAGAGPLPDVPGVEITHEFHDLPAGRFHVARAGDPSKPAIMLVHGFPQHWWCWHGVVQELAADAHLVMPDLRGYGWSAVPSGRSAYTKGELANDLGLLLDAMGIEQIAVVGHDWGAWVSQLLALRRPELVSRLLLLSMAPVIQGPRPPARTLLRMWYQVAFAAPGSAAVISRDPGLIGRGIRQDVQRPEAFTSADAHAYAELYRDPARAKAAQHCYRSFLLGDAAKTFAATKGQRFAMPVRFVLSAHDAYVPPGFAAGAERLGAQVEAFVQDRTGHFLPDEDPGYTAEQVREFVIPHAAPLS